MPSVLRAASWSVLSRRTLAVVITANWSELNACMSSVVSATILSVPRLAILSVLRVGMLVAIRFSKGRLP
jgi:hypothetical protein